MIEVTGPTLIDLKTRTNSNYEDLATAVAGQDVGLFIGSIIGGFLVDKIGLYLELLVALALDVGAVGTIGIPWSPWTQLIWCFCCLQGIGAGVINTGTHALCVTLSCSFSSNEQYRYCEKLPSVVCLLSVILLTRENE